MMIEKRTVILQRTVIERVTVELPMSAAVPEAITSWANFGASGASPFDLLPEHFPRRAKEITDWQISVSEPPLPEPKQERITHKKGK